MRLAINIVCALCWAFNAAAAFARAHAQHVEGNHGWAGEALWFGLASTLLSLDAVVEMMRDAQ